MDKKAKIKQNQLDLIYKILPNVKFGKSVQSPIKKDKHPSFVVYNNAGNIYYIDYRLCSGDLIDLYMKLNDCSFDRAVDELYDMLDKSTFIENKTTSKPNKPEIKKQDNRIIKYNITDLLKYDEKYFLKHNISKDVLYDSDVYTLLDFLYYNETTGKRFEIHSSVKLRAFFYNYGDIEKGAFKVYTPNPKSFFANFNNKADIIYGKKHLQNTNYVIIESAKKNYMVLRSAGYNVLEKQDENIHIPNKILDILKSKYKYIINVANNDLYKSENWGINLAERIKREQNIPYIYPSDKLCVNSDISDYADISIRYGLDTVKKDIDNQLNNLLC